MGTIIEEDLQGVIVGVEEAVSSWSADVLQHAVLLFVLGAIAIRVLLWLGDRGMRVFGVEKGLRSFLRTLVKALLWCFLLIAVGSILGFDPSSLMTLVGVFTLAFSLAIQGSLANVAGGLTLMVTKPFVVGDYIEISGTTGLVQEIGLIHTVMDTTDSKVIFVPNSQITTAKIINYSRHRNRRIELIFRAAAEEDPRRVRDIMLEAVDKVEDVLADPAPYVGVGGFSEKGTEYVLRVWVNNQHYRTVTFDLQESVRAAFVAGEVHFALQLSL